MGRRMDGWTDGQTDGPTFTTFYRCVKVHLKEINKTNDASSALYVMCFVIVIVAAVVVVDLRMDGPS